MRLDRLIKLISKVKKKTEIAKASWLFLLGVMSATPPQIVTQKSTEKRHSFYSFDSTNNTLMGDWLERTKSRHFGAFGDSYPKVSPFSAKKQTVKELVSRAIVIVTTRMSGGTNFASTQPHNPHFRFK